MKKARVAFIAVLVFAVIASLVFAFGANAVAAEATTIPEGNGEIDVYLIAGQSNAIGSANVSKFPYPEGYDKYVNALTEGIDNVWYMGDFNAEFVHTTFGLSTSSSQSGPEIGIATALMDGSRENAIIKLAWGNTSLYHNTGSNESKLYGTWTPPSYIEKHSVVTEGNRTGDLYLNFIDKVAVGIEQLRDKGYTPVIKGLWWMQGEADTFSASSSEVYEELLTDLISDMRSDIGKVMGYDHSEMPFVYGRILRREGFDPSKSGNPYIQATPFLNEVQAAQERVAKKGLKNVFMINTATDLIDPLTGEHRLPFQQDGWHYDPLSQQMIGEAFVRTVSPIAPPQGVATNYGYITETNTSNAPFAIFKKVGDFFVFDSYQTNTEWAVGRAVALTHSQSGTTDEAVILLLDNFGSGSYGKNVANSGGTITLDLAGHTFSPSVSVFRTDVADCFASGKNTNEKTTVNVKNGTILLQQFGIIFNNAGTTVTAPKEFDFNITNVDFGFISSTAANAASDNVKTNKYEDLLVSDRGYTKSQKATFNIFCDNCSFDLDTNGIKERSNKADYPQLGTFGNGSDTDTADYHVTLKSCSIKAPNAECITEKVYSGDSITFVADKDGNYGNITLPGVTSAPSTTYKGEVYGDTVDIKYSLVSGNNYKLILSNAVNTQYGTISAAYASAEAYPFAVFTKTASGAYTFVEGYSNWKKALEKADDNIGGSANSGNESVLLVRRNADIGGSLYDGANNITGTLTIDLGGHTVTASTSIMSTIIKSGTENTAKTTVNIKNGGLVNNSQYGFIYNRVDVNDAASKTYDFRFTNVNISLGPKVSTRSILVHAMTDANDANAMTFNMTFENCVIDAVANTVGITCLANMNHPSESANYGKFNYNLTFIGGRIDASDLFAYSTSGDTVTLLKDSSGKYTEIASARGSRDFKAVTVEGGVSLTPYKTSDGWYSEYELSEDVKTPYGYVPKADASNPFAIFALEKGSYVYKGVAANTQLALEAALALTHVKTGTHTEAVVVLLKNYGDGKYLSNAADNGGTIILDLNGYTLSASTAVFRTDVDDDGAGVKPTYVVKNGSLLLQMYGMIFNTGLQGSATGNVSREFDFYIENVKFGFISGTSALEQKDQRYTDLIASERGYNNPASTTYNIYVTGCTVDMVKNAPANAQIGRFTSPNTDNKKTNYNLYFTDTTFLAESVSAITGIQSVASGSNMDKVIFCENENGQYPIVRLPEGVLPETFSAENELGEALELKMVGAAGAKIYYRMGQKDAVITPYGEIPADLASSASYPFVIFYNGKVEGFASYKEAMNRAVVLTKADGTGVTAELTILMRRNNREDSYPTNLSDIGGTVNLDLGGYQLIAKSSFGSTYSDDCGNNPKGTINVFGGRILLIDWGLVFASKGDTFVDGAPTKVLEYNFKDVYIGFYTASGGEPTIVGNDRGTIKEAIFNINFDGCTLDLVTNMSSQAQLAKLNSTNSAGKFIFNVNFSGGTRIISDTLERLNFSNDSRDTVTFTKDEDGNYPRLKIASCDPVKISYTADNGKNLYARSIDLVGETVYLLHEGENYVLDEGVVIPAYYSNAIAYPMLLVDNSGNVVGTYTNFKTAMAAAEALLAAKNGVTSETKAWLAIRADRTITSGELYSNTSNIGGTLVIDLGGNTVTLETSLMSIRGFDYEAGKSAKTTLEIRNGALINNSPYGILYQRTEAELTVDKEFDVIFDNVKFSYASSATTPSLVIYTFNQNKGSADIYNNVTFNNCTFDLDTNVPQGSVLANLKTVNSNGYENKANAMNYDVTFNGCAFEGAKAFSIPMSDAGDSVTFGKGNALKVGASESAPDSTFNLGGEGAKFVQYGTEGSYKLYKLVPLSVVEFTPKSNITLYMDFVYNIYVPKSNVTDITLDGNAFNTASLECENIGGVDCYKLSVELNSFEALRDISLEVALIYDGDSYSGSYVFSVYSYAQDIIGGEYSDEAKTLVKDMLSYVKASYAYWSKTSDKLSDIDTLLGQDYASTADMTLAGSAEAPVGTGFTGVTLHLGDAPSYRFYYTTDTAPDYTFTVGSRAVEAVEGIEGEGGNLNKYLEIKVFAYELLEGVTFGDYTYSAYAYYAWAESKNMTAETALVERLLNYCEAAQAYRKSVIE